MKEKLKKFFYEWWITAREFYSDAYSYSRNYKLHKHYIVCPKDKDKDRDEGK